MKHKGLRFGKGFRVALTNRRTQAAEMVIEPGAAEGGPYLLLGRTPIVELAPSGAILATGGSGPRSPPLPLARCVALTAYDAAVVGARQYLAVRTFGPPLELPCRKALDVNPGPPSDKSVRADFGRFPDAALSPLLVSRMAA